MSQEPNTTPSGPKSAGPGGPSQRQWLMIIPIVAGLLLLLVAVVLIVIIGTRSLFSGDKADPSMHLPVTRVAATQPISSLLPIAVSCETIVGSDDVQVAVSLPISLTVGSRSMPIAVAAPDLQGWSYPLDQSGAAAWICGTVVNHVVGLEPTPENEALLAQLRPGDEITLARSNGVTLAFRFVEQRDGVTANEASVFEQSEPRLTLILEKEDGSWRVATADYVAESEPVEPPTAGTGTAQLGQPVRVGDVQVVATRGHVERNVPNLPPGTMYYLVEYSVENAGTAQLDATVFDMQLKDALGSSYLPSPAASILGDHGPLSGPIAAGAKVEGTAGYLVADTLAGPTLIWTLRPRPDSGLQASVSIPYEATTAPPPAAVQADVTIGEALLSGDGKTLIIEGEIQNTGGVALTVEVADLSLTSSAGMGSLLMAAPPLPWTVEPGQTRVIELQYERPDAAAALLMLLGHSFEIGGLQK